MFAKPCRKWATFLTNTTKVATQNATQSKFSWLITSIKQTVIVSSKLLSIGFCAYQAYKYASSPLCWFCIQYTIIIEHRVCWLNPNNGGLEVKKMEIIGRWTHQVTSLSTARLPRISLVWLLTRPQSPFSPSHVQSSASTAPKPVFDSGNPTRQRKRAWVPRSERKRQWQPVFQTLWHEIYVTPTAP